MTISPLPSPASDGFPDGSPDGSPGSLAGGDRLVLRGIRAYGYTGYFAEEQRLGQWFEVDLVLWLDLGVAGRDDRLESTLDYGAVVQWVQNQLKSTQVKTLEALAESLAQGLLTRFGVARLQVSLTKCHPPIPDFAGQVTVIIERSSHTVL
ncbi:dihydroneopterin aldolase [Prochlorothrix hollandica]|uniref:dihydroneopterin aldolase n=1 Tax=Prochlorothrix hollandica TaxID=1223 RepID=UPI0033409A8D